MNATSSKKQSTREVTSEREISTLYSSDVDSIDTVAVYKRRKGYSSYAEAMDKLIAAARAIGLHRRDIEPEDIRKPQAA